MDNNIYLFDSTVKYNVTLLDRELTEEEKVKLEKITKALNMKELVEKNASLKQFGANLSGGQKLKISIARALFKNTELLILDEPTASLDKDSEELLCNLLSKIQATVLIVTHRPEILKICNKVYEINEENQVIKVKDNTEKGGREYENKI
ncbi:ATP-binding cassette domain-containing protein [Leptotrichia sp. OH3620_COT-345]|nr:ATP-binding cassette domain-containing protein [Leptotrichia sp. OH3620_COT-345]